MQVKFDVRSTVLALSLGASAFSVIAPSALYAQETTGSLQGTVKDPSGAVVANATVTVTTPTLVGVKSTKSNASGYYHFTNLPPGSYVVTVDAKGFLTEKESGLMIEVGHTPTFDVKLVVGSEASVVDVTADTPQIDVSSVTTLTNITQDVINFVPRGTSFQSVIQFAPGASNEPLMGNTTTNGSGSVSPGNGSNGNSFGYSIAGGADSENSYLVEGQETANLIGGYSHTNVPFDFIQEVEVKTSGIQAEYGGALGGVINVIMKKGSNRYHGGLFAQFENQGLDSSPNAFSRYDPHGAQAYENWQGSFASYHNANDPNASPNPLVGGLGDAPYQNYQPKKDHYADFQPGFNLGGPLLPMLPRFADRLFFFVGFNPDLNRDERRINYGPASTGNPETGVLPFSQNTNTYYTTARVDAQVSRKIRVFGSYLYQLQRQNGEALPFQDSTQGYNNLSTSNSAATYGHNLGFSAPNTTFNTGADITLSSAIVATTRFGYYFENYHDFGYPENGVVSQFQNPGLDFPNAVAGTLSGPLVQLTRYNASKAIEFNQDIAIYKSTHFGTHNFKFGYQLSRNSNNISQIYNEPYLQVFPDTGYTPGSPQGTAVCAGLTATYGNCEGQFGFVTVYDFGTAGKATAYDNGFYGQDSWNLGHGVTVDYGLRLEKEFLPGEAVGGGAPQKPIDFGFGDKIAPRVGAAWDVFRDGKMKVFGGYGVFYDQFKLNLAISSFGGQYWNNCTYALNTTNIASILPMFNGMNRDCPSGTTTTPANFAGGTQPAALTFIENLNERAFPTTCSTCSAQQEGVAPGLKPYEQHESLIGTDYQLNKTVALEVRYDRRRLDHAIEDAAIYNPAVGETFVIVNPGQGSNATFNGYYNFLYGPNSLNCGSGAAGCPPNQNPAAARSYDGVEVRLSKAMSHNWYGLFSYTYSHFRGNYTGLTSSDISDGGNGGRNSPNNSRAFDEPYFQYNAQGGSSSGLLPTDRPNKFKADAYYQFKYSRKFVTNLGLFQYFYQGSPNTTYTDVGYSENAFPVKPFDFGKWANVTQNQATGAITVGNPYTYRNPWYNQTDFSLVQEIHVNDKNNLNFQATMMNLFNDHAVTAVNSQIDSSYSGGQQYVAPQGQAIFNGVPFYTAAMTPYNLQQALNGQAFNGGPTNSQGGPETINSQYGKPLYYQHRRQIRLQLNYNF